MGSETGRGSGNVKETLQVFEEPYATDLIEETVFFIASDKLCDCAEYF